MKWVVPDRAELDRVVLECYSPKKVGLASPLEASEKSSAGVQAPLQTDKETNVSKSNKEKEDFVFAKPAPVQWKGKDFSIYLPKRKCKKAMDNLQGAKKSRNSIKKTSAEKETFHVEAIRAKREKDGITYFYVKWLGYPEYDNTWENVEYLGCCKKLIDDFTKQQEAKQKAKNVASSSTSCETGVSVEIGGEKADDDDDDDDDDDFDGVDQVSQERIPERLVHVTNINGKIEYLVQWKDNGNNNGDKSGENNVENFTLVPGEEFRLKYPQMVIKFFTSRLERHDPPNEENTVSD